MRMRAGLCGLLMAYTVAVAAHEPAPTAQQSQGKALYNHLCVYCHSPGVWGTNRLAKRQDKDHAVLESRTDLTASLIRTAVRSGIGSMPPLRKSELSDADVDAIAAYLTRQPR